MKKKKHIARWGALALALCLVLAGLLPICAGAVYDDHPFTDLGVRNPYESFINQGVKLGIVSGTSQTSFSPERQVTRGEAAAMLGRMHEAYTGQPVGDGTATAFRDVPQGEYYAKYVNWAEENGLAAGYGDGTFRPGRAIANCELAVMLHNYINLVGAQWLYPSEGDAGEHTPPAWAEEAIREMNRYGIYAYNGVPEEAFLDPWRKSTREMTVTAVVRLYERVLFRPNTNDPRLSYHYEAKPIDPDGPDYHPLGEEGFRVVSSAEEFFCLRKQLEEDTRQMTVQNQYCNLELSEAFFTEYDLLAVDVQAKFHPDFSARWMDLELRNGVATVDFVCDGLVGRSLDVRGYIFFLVVPKGVGITTVNQRWYHLTEKSWTTSAEDDWEEWGKELPPLLSAE